MINAKIINYVKKLINRLNITDYYVDIMLYNKFLDLMKKNRTLVTSYVMKNII